MSVEPPRHPGSPIISSTQPPIAGHQMPGGLLQQAPKQSPLANQSWKSNEARRPKTYNCTACNKWFTSSGHLKRHYNTTLHKNAVKQSNQPDPANMPISAHHHPGRDNHSGGRGGGQRSITRTIIFRESPKLDGRSLGRGGEGPAAHAHHHQSLQQQQHQQQHQQQFQQQQQQQQQRLFGPGGPGAAATSPFGSALGLHNGAAAQFAGPITNGGPPSATNGFAVPAIGPPAAATAAAAPSPANGFAVGPASGPPSHEFAHVAHAPAAGAPPEFPFANGLVPPAPHEFAVTHNAGLGPPSNGFAHADGGYYDASSAVPKRLAPPRYNYYQHPGPAGVYHHPANYYW